MKNRAFTLIELLAVIIILGILMLIAIPGVTSYINNSRKNVYVDTAKELIRGASNLLNSGGFDNLDEDVTYYIDSRCIASETGKEAQSPFGKFNPAYVLVVNEDDQYNYYFQSRDDTSVGVKQITNLDSLELSKIVSDVKEEDIDTTVSIGNTSKVAVIDENCNIGETRVASKRVSRDGESMVTLTFDNQGGDGCTSQSQYYGDEWGKLCRPKKTGFRFMGWFTNTSGEGEKIKETDSAEKSMKAYAHWVEKQEATFDKGETVHLKLRTLAGDNTHYYDGSSKVNYFKLSEEEPTEENMQDANIISAPNSEGKIYAWFEEDTGTMYWWSFDDDPSLNEDSSKMFYALSNIKKIEGIELFDTSNVTTMREMFSGCKSLLELDLSNFDTSKLTSLNNTFYYCSSLLSLDVSSFDTSNVMYMQGTFSGCKSLENIDISNFDTSKVTNMNNMFASCYSLTSIDLSNFNTSKVTKMGSLFYFCKNLEQISLTSFDTSKVETMDYMFSNCEKLSSVDLSRINAEKVTGMSYMFENCKALTSLNLNSFVTPKLTIMTNMFYNCSNLSEVKLDNFNTSLVTSMYYLFYNCTNLSSINLLNFSVSNVTTMDKMFYNCSSLTTLNLSSFVTTNLSNMDAMFFNCNKLEELNISHFDTHNITEMGGLFYNCSSLTSLDLSSFDTGNVTSFGRNYQRASESGTVSTGYGGMFEKCKSLTSLNLSNFNMSSARDLGRMFSECESLTSIDLSSFSLPEARSMGEMFYKCTSLEVLDISSFYLPNCYDIHEMFGDCANLKTIYASDDLNLDSVLYDVYIFRRCTMLKGGAGTEWAYSMTSNKKYARVDKEGQAGLFTSKA